MKTAEIHILILTDTPFSKRDYDRFGVEVLSQGFQVSILDCTPWLRPDFWDKYSSLAYRCSGYISVASMESVVACLSRQMKVVAIDYLGICARSQRIRMELKSRNIPRTVVLLGVLPIPASKWSDRVRQTISMYKPCAIPGKIYQCIKRLLGSQGLVPEIALLSGSVCLKGKNLYGVTQKIWAHSFDFDIYLGCRGQRSASVAPYAVFLDEDMIYHSDYEYFGAKPPTTEHAYYASMNDFLQKLERNVGLPVIVAAHPRSRYDLRPQLWNGRATVYAKTAQLVRDATLVLCHQSTAVSFAVMWRKPIIFLTTNELMSSYFGPGIALRSTLLRAQLINVDMVGNQLPDIKSLSKVDEVAYAKYIDEYIKRPGTPNLPVWQIFSEYLQREFQ